MSRLDQAIRENVALLRKAADRLEGYRSDEVDVELVDDLRELADDMEARIGR